MTERLWDGTYSQSTVPTGVKDIAAIAGGLYHSLVVKRAGTVVRWGDNTYNQKNIPTKLAKNNFEAVQADALSLTIGYGGSDTTDSVNQNVTLPTSGATGTAISWASSDINYITSCGLITRPTETTPAWHDVPSTHRAFKDIEAATSASLFSLEK